MLSFRFTGYLALRFLRMALLLSTITLPCYAYSASKTILVLGDSLSAEYGLARGQGWVNLLSEKLRSEKTGMEVVNASISGETTSGGKNRLPALIEKHKPDVVIIELGGNDALRGLSLKASDDNLHAMIQLAKLNKAKVLLIGMQIPPNYGKEYTEAFTSLFQKIAKEQKISLVPFLLEGIANNPSMFQQDRIHPIAAAHPLILNNVWPMLTPIIKK